MVVDGQLLPQRKIFQGQFFAGLGMVQMANDNCPGQVVVGGTLRALEEFAKLGRELKWRTVKLRVSFHLDQDLLMNTQNSLSGVLILGRGCLWS